MSLKKHKEIMFYKSSMRIEGVEMASCGYCGLLYAWKNLTVDHVIRRRDGGTDDRWNLKLACTLCNQAREGPVDKKKLESWRKKGIRWENPFLTKEGT